MRAGGSSRSTSYARVGVRHDRTDLADAGVSKARVAGFLLFDGEVKNAAQHADGVRRRAFMMDKARALPTSPQTQQQQQDVINRILAA